MNQRIKSIIAIYLSAYLQGVVLVLYPAAGAIFTSQDFHGLSGAEFGILFTPQIAFAILSSLSASKFAERYGMKRVLSWGLMSNLLSMLFFAGSVFCIGMSNLPFWSLMAGTATLGAGFGFTITALNPLAYHLFPGKEASAVTGMHIFLGLGTTSAPLLLSAFQGMGWWWGSSLIIAVLILLMILFQVPLPLSLPPADEEESQVRGEKIPFRIWLFALVIFLYAFSEATFGNWGTIYLEKEAGLAATSAALGLSVFWASITVGRVLFTFLALRFNTKTLYLAIPFVVAGVFLIMPGLEGRVMNLAAMAVGGLGLSFYFPNSISIATDEFPRHAAIVSGAMVAAIQLGTGVSANVVGFLSQSFSLGLIFQMSAAYGALTGLLGIYLHFSNQKNHRSLTNCVELQNDNP